MKYTLHLQRTRALHLVFIIHFRPHLIEMVLKADIDGNKTDIPWLDNPREELCYKLMNIYEAISDDTVTSRIDHSPSLQNMNRVFRNVLLHDKYFDDDMENAYFKLARKEMEGPKEQLVLEAMKETETEFVAFKTALDRIGCKGEFDVGDLVSICIGKDLVCSEFKTMRKSIWWRYNHDTALWEKVQGDSYIFNFISKRFRRFFGVWCIKVKERNSKKRKTSEEEGEEEEELAARCRHYLFASLNKNAFIKRIAIVVGQHANTSFQVPAHASQFY
jgi:hypothetical protein